MIGMAQGDVYTIGVRLRVARFDELGNAKAFNGETSDRYRFSRFFIAIINRCIAESGELIGTENRMSINYKFFIP